MRSRKSLLLVDGDRATCASVTALLERFDVHVAHCAADALALAATCRPSIVAIDLELPDGDGVDVIAALSQRDSDLPILVLSRSSSEARVVAALRAGARGYSCKARFARKHLIDRSR